MWTARLRKAVRLLRRPIYRRGLLMGVGATVEHEGALRRLTVNSVVDVGANNGQFSLLARALYPEAVIHAFEPLVQPRQHFRRLFAHDRRVTLHALALGEDSGTATIHVSRRMDSSSLLPITERQSILYPGTGSAGTQTITVARGDEMLDPSELPRPLLVKLDVQGFELAALKGISNLLASVDYIYLEMSFVELYSGQPLADELISFLRERGFRLTGIYNLSSARDGLAIQTDGLFSRF